MEINGNPPSRDEAIADLRISAQGFARRLDAALRVGVGPAVILPLLAQVLEEEGIELPPLAAGLLGGP